MYAGEGLLLVVAECRLAAVKLELVCTNCCRSKKSMRAGVAVNLFRESSAGGVCGVSAS